MERWKYGIIAVALGLAALVGCFVLATRAYDTATDAAAVLGIVTGTIGTVIAAYFGVQAASEGRQQAQNEAVRAREELTTESRKVARLSAELPPEAARTILNTF